MDNRRVIRRGLGWLLFIPANALAMEPMSDQELADVQGQADMIAIDRIEHPGDEQVYYQRISTGMEIDLQTNIKRLELGRYDREGQEPGTSDVLIENLSLGYIQDRQYFQRNPRAARQLKDDGTPYEDGEIVPFSLYDPFFEIAHDSVTNDPIGVRLGFRGAEGMASGTFRSLTGNINVDILDRGQGLQNADSQGTLFDQLLNLLAPVVAGDSPLKTDAKLVYGPDSPRVGEIREARADHIGVANGETFLLEDVNGAVAGIVDLISGGLSSQLEVTNCSGFGPFGNCDLILEANNCEIIGITACFPLEQFQSIPIGEQEDVNGRRTIVGPARGLFISGQNQDLDWIEDIRGGNPTREDLIKATRGTFFNIPNESITLNLQEALDGTERVRTEYIDRGNGLF
mgnify:FL=1